MEAHRLAEFESSPAGKGSDISATSVLVLPVVVLQELSLPDENVPWSLLVSLAQRCRRNLNLPWVPKIHERAAFYYPSSQWYVDSRHIDLISTHPWNSS